MSARQNKQNSVPGKKYNIPNQKCLWKAACNPGNERLWVLDHVKEKELSVLY